MKENLNLIKSTILFLLLIFASGQILAQNRMITGTVIGEDGLGIPGATIAEKGTENGTISDMNGKYSIRVASKTQTLVFSFIGMETKEVDIANRNIIDVTMTSTIVGMDEVIVVGYGVQTKESMLSAIDQVSGDELESLRAPNVSSALSGMSPGLISVTSSGQPGEDGASLYIRGRSSVNNDEALVVVDGVEQLSDFSYMDPNEISSISILKDAAATAVYGVKGANGVIIITTKRGSISKPKLSFNSTFTFKQPTSPVEMANSYETLSLYNIASKNDGQFDQLISDEALQHYKDQDMPYLYPDVDWYDVLTKSFSTAQKHNFSARGGTAKVKYFLSLGYTHEGDAFKEVDLDLGYKSKNTFDVLSYRTNLDFDLSPSTTFKTDFAGRMQTKNEASSLSFTSDFYDYPSWASPVYYPGELLEEYPDDNPVHPDSSTDRWAYNNLIQNSNNPYTILHGSGLDTRRRNVLTANFELTQQLDFISKGLSVSGRYNFSLNYLFLQEINYTPRDFYLWEDGTWENVDGEDAQQGNASIGTEKNTYKQNQSYYNLSLNYKRSFGAHNISALWLWSRKKKETQSDFPLFKEDRVGRFTYNYNKRYFIEASGAQNGTDKFAPGKKFGFFPAVSIGWSLGNETFVRNALPFVNKLKVRASYGQSGSESGSSAMMYLSTFDYISSGDEANYRMKFGDDFNDSGDLLTHSILGNENATWETATKKNIGVDFTLFKNHIVGNVDFYNEERDGIFVSPQDIPSYLGTTAKIQKVNRGETKKHGYEIELKYIKQVNNDFNYSITAAYGFSENRRGDMAEGIYAEDYLKDQGKPLNTNKILMTNGLYQNIDEVLNSVIPTFGGNWMPGDIMYVDYNADGEIDEVKDKIFYGDPKTASTIFSLTLRANYKKWHIQAFISGQDDVSASATGFYFPFYQERASQVRPEHFNYWSPDNADASWPITHYTSTAYKNSTTSNTYTLLDASFIRLKNVELSYDLQSNNRILPFNCTLFVSAYNLFTITDMKYGDPEGGNVGNYPILKRYNLGLKVNF
ncbi:SusC/RagA family TonB-linked outer membrane protein [Saccharicrinis fermentans]|uniref:TonB-linked outer membrane protein, SusC/RagA family n=1 Tax=Saccharicrinis fermentans DSM 9555 = JCM 21142 TaxID=869213 RepID=W7YLT0_9BACT|nr:TonB-dependent receptor [Saccharicrinis fermentans]GAF03329.1 TonB-linked outer membrane protein, SusC/RagA family [Saccharicrinis fermentans DSM 9555 = JCM 21142]